MQAIRKRGSLFSGRTQTGFSTSGGSILFPAGPSGEATAFALFQPDVLLPSQYLDTTRRKTYLEPEKKLMLAILEDAIWCFQNGLLATDARRKSLLSEAKEWIMEEGRERLFAFENVCDILDLNPRYIRKGLAAWKVQRLKDHLQARVYRVSHLGARSKKRISEPRKARQRLRKAAGY